MPSKSALGTRKYVGRHRIMKPLIPKKILALKSHADRKRQKGETAELAQACEDNAQIERECTSQPEIITEKERC